MQQCRKPLTLVIPFCFALRSHEIRRSEKVISQLRIYTINRGMMDSWLTLFEEHVKPIHEKYGIPIEKAWVNSDRTEFIWVRSFASADDIPGKENAYYSSPERKALGDTPTNHIAKMEVRVIERALPGPSAA